MSYGVGRTALIIGSLTRDFDRGGSPDSGFQPGGVVFHAGTALARLGVDVRVVTRVHPSDADTLVSALRAEGIEVIALPSRATTTYALDYSGAIDIHELRERSDTIEPADIPPAWLATEIVQLGPLHRQDFDPALIPQLRGLVGIDVQGLVRQATSDGTGVRPFADLSRFLEGTDVVQVSESELPAALGDIADARAFARRFGIRELIITRGDRGASLIVEGEVEEIPALPSSGRHSVGAGDVFLAVYLLLRSGRANPKAAAGTAVRVCAAKADRGQVPKGLPL